MNKDKNDQSPFWLPENWHETCNGAGCKCHAYGECECGCGADWTPFETYELRELLNDLLEASYPYLKRKKSTPREQCNRLNEVHKRAKCLLSYGLEPDA